MDNRKDILYASKSSDINANVVEKYQKIVEIMESSLTIFETYDAIKAVVFDKSSC